VFEENEEKKVFLLKLNLSLLRKWEWIIMEITCQLSLMFASVS
jgi:hypothetical protein